MIDLQSIEQLAAKAERPAKFPKGFFSPLVPVTGKLLEKGFKIRQVADWLIQNKAMKAGHRARFLEAMHSQLHRLRRKGASRAIREGREFVWMESFAYESTHLCAAGESVALCGARSHGWGPEVSATNRCCRCVGAQKRLQAPLSRSS